MSLVSRDMSPQQMASTPIRRNHRLQRTRGKRRSAERELSKLIADDLAANPDFSNSHRIDIGASLAAPTRLTCEDSLRDNASLDLSLVLEECPGGKHGYLVVFDEERCQFGLAVPGKRDPVFIGYYGHPYCDVRRPTRRCSGCAASGAPLAQDRQKIQRNAEMPLTSRSGFRALVEV
jgi:hypothetical protein